jgi:hypothetical protein
MAQEEQQNKSLAAKAAWPLLVLTAVLHAFFGLSAVAYLFMGVLKPVFGLGAWTVATMGGLQAVAAVVACVRAARRDLRGAILAVAACMMLGWLSTLPSVIVQGLEFHRDDKTTAIYFVVAPPIAIAAAMLAWRNVHLIAAALLVSAMTFVGILFVIAFGIAIAMYGF